jgi:hypothetical protein
MQLIEFIEEFYSGISDCITTFNMICSENLSLMNIDNPNENTDFNEDIEELLKDINNQNYNSIDKFKRKLDFICKSFRDNIHSKAELLILLSAFRREDGKPLLDFFFKYQIDKANNLKKVKRNKVEFMTQVTGDSSFIGCFYKVIFFEFIIVIF